MKKKMNSGDNKPDEKKLITLKNQHQSDKAISDEKEGINPEGNPQIDIPEKNKTSEAQTTEAPKKRGRPKGSKNKPRESTLSEIEGLIPPAIIKSVIALPYQYLAKKRGEFWSLSDAELESMIIPHQRLAQKYIPDVMKEHLDLYAVLLMHGMIIFARVEIEMKLKKETESYDDTLKVGVNGSVESFNNSREKRYGQIYNVKPDSTE